MKMKSIIRKRDVVSFLIGVLLTAFLSGVWYSHSLYYQNVSSTFPVSVSYHGVTVRTSFNADYADRFIDPKRTLYFGELENAENIEIRIHRKARMMVYPRDDDSVYLTYSPHNGISRNYILSKYGNFNKHLEILYDITGNEVFNETVDLPPAE